MTREELDKKRDEFLIKHEGFEPYGPEIINDIFSCTCFRSGWDKAVETLWSEIERLEVCVKILRQKGEAWQEKHLEYDALRKDVYVSRFNELEIE